MRDGTIEMEIPISYSIMVFQIAQAGDGVRFYYKPTMQVQDAAQVSNRPKNNRRGELVVNHLPLLDCDDYVNMLDTRNERFTSIRIQDHSTGKRNEPRIVFAGTV